MNQINIYNNFNKRKGNSSINRFLPFIIILIIIIMSILLLNKKEKLILNVSDITMTKFTIKALDENIIAQLKGANYSNSASSRFLNARAMVIGDSTAEGLEAYQILDGISVTWTRGRVIQYMEEDLKDAYSYQPNAIILAYGANDLLSWNGNVNGYINAYDKVIRNIKEQFPNATIGVNEILPVSDTALSRNPAYGYRQEFNDKLKEFCKENNVIFIENSFLLDEAKDGKKFESDGVHPKPFYYKLWANNMADVMGF